MKINRAFCLFEQSGTWKREFRKLGIDAYDFDIQDDFGETDHVVDLFEEIDRAYDGEPSLFDGISADDIVIAFFPCTRFECQVKMWFSGDHATAQKQTDEKKLLYVMRLHDELNMLYRRLCKLFLVCIRRGIRLVVENPASQPHYLTGYFPVKPTIIDRDRTEAGDYYKKPTQYWFINCEPEQGVCFEAQEEREIYKIEGMKKTNGIGRQTMRSLMHPQYARWFIRSLILGGGGE